MKRLKKIFILTIIVLCIIITYNSSIAYEEVVDSQIKVTNIGITDENLRVQNLKSVMFKETTETMLGDIDLDERVTVNDLAMLKLHIIGKEILIKEKSLISADIDKDNQITTNDLAMLKLHLIGLLDINDNKNNNENDNEKDDEIIVQDTSFKGFYFEQMTPVNERVTFERLNFQNLKQKAYGIYGAGSQ